MRGPAVIMLDREGRVSAWNGGAEVVYGYAAREVIGEHLGIFYAGPGQAEKDLGVAAAEGERETEGSRLRADGTRFRASAKITVQRDDRGGVLGFTDVVGDIVETEDGARESRFLAEASRILSSSLEYRETLSKVAHLVVPRLADWCVVDVLEEDGTISNVALAHRDPEKIALARRWRERYPPDPGAERGVPRVLRTGRPELIPETTAALLEEAAGDGEHREILRSLDLASYMVVPLAARGRMLGAISLVTGSSGRRYGPQDLELAEDLAARAALAVDNARLYEEAQREISVRERAEEALRHSEERYRGVIERAAEGIYLVDARTGRVIDGNAAFCRLLGYAREEVIGMSVYDLLDHDRAEIERNIEATSAGGIREVGERRYRRGDGSPLYAVSNGSAMIHEGRKVISILMHDVTERKRAEEALRRSECSLRAAQAMARIGDWEYDLDGDRARWSDELFRIFGLPAGEPPAFRGFFDLVHPGDRPAVRREVFGILRGGEKSSKDYRIVRPDGEVRNVHTEYGVTRDASGRGVGIVGTIQDITERKRAEAELEALVEELRRSNVELEQFAHVASHDLQEPLRMVSSFTQLLRRRYEGQLDETADEFIGYAVDGANRMQALINALLEYSRLGTRGRPLAAVETERVFDAALANLGNAVAESGAEVVSGGLPTVLGDEVQLMQLFQNLISNAIKFRGEEPPRVRVGARRQGREWLFSVEDNGIGIGPEYGERIFVIFQRLHGREEYSGTGIGLALCRKIVERHGGKIRVESRPGRGSTFYFTLASPT